jgi:hypothetical protein
MSVEWNHPEWHKIGAGGSFAALMPLRAGAVQKIPLK